MNYVIFLAKWILIAEIILILLFLLMSYGAKFLNILKTKKRNSEYVRLKKSLLSCLKNKHELTKNDINICEKLIPEVLSDVHQFDIDCKDDPYWPIIRQQLIMQVLRPAAKKFATTKNHLKRYIATQCFAYAFEVEDEPLILNLLSDPALLVSLNAARIALKYRSSVLINAMITVFSQGRHLQQTEFSCLIAEGEEFGEILPIVEQRLVQKDDSPYVKAFCIHLLTIFPPSGDLNLIMPYLDAENLELKLEVMNFLAHQNQEKATEILRGFIRSNVWQIRVRAINLLGDLRDEISMPEIAENLKNSEWWVRVRAAEALIKFGNKGIIILKSQHPEAHLAAYETASHVLTMLQHQGKEYSR